MHSTPYILRLLPGFAAVAFCWSWATAQEQQPAQEKPAATSETPTESSGSSAGDWHELFDGKSLDGWKTLDMFSFNHHGEVQAADGQIVLEAGSPATGIGWPGEFPAVDYEISLEAMRCGVSTVILPATGTIAPPEV